MGMIKGIPVTLYERSQTGVDSFGAPIYAETPVTVQNVLVSPSTTDDIVNSTSLYGKKAVYQLAIPKGDQHIWEDSTVEFFGRKWRTFGFMTKGIEENIPLDWNGKIQVEAYGS